MQHITHLSQESFVKLFGYILNDLNIRKVYLSQKAPACKSRKTPVTPFARIDIPLSGRKHMQFACNNEIQDINMQLPSPVLETPALGQPSLDGFDRICAGLHPLHLH